MGKDTFYFSHDYNARTDEKIKLLIRKHGLKGYGIFWAIVEDLYNNANALQTDYEGIAFELREDIEVIKSVVNDFNLFQFEDNTFGSLSVQKRLDERNEKSQTARQSAFKRWNKNKDDANALQMQSEGNAIKERKGKEIKDNTIFSFSDFWEMYPHKVAKQKCETKYKNITEKEREQIKLTLAKFLSYKPFDSYTHPNPEPYLNQKRWQDVIPENVIKVEPAKQKVIIW